ncbi:hypothetical protein BJV82DRAFT_634816 [Fennellomyces sp. T-0311]|nr:hypothetical protein BJV82DRAFT_634816 [Fennellomyces sp. T-0311]
MPMRLVDIPIWNKSINRYYLHVLLSLVYLCRILTYQSSIVYIPFHLSLYYIRSFISTSTTAQLSIGLFTGLCVSETLIWVQTSRRTIHVNSVSA